MNIERLSDLSTIGSFVFTALGVGILSSVVSRYFSRKDWMSKYDNVFKGLSPIERNILREFFILFHTGRQPLALPGKDQHVQFLLWKGLLVPQSLSQVPGYLICYIDPEFVEYMEKRGELPWKDACSPRVENHPGTVTLNFGPFPSIKRARKTRDHLLFLKNMPPNSPLGRPSFVFSMSYNQANSYRIDYFKHALDSSESYLFNMNSM